MLFHSFHFLWGWECAPLPHCHLKPSKIENHFLPATNVLSEAHGIILTHFCVDLLGRHLGTTLSRFRSWVMESSLGHYHIAGWGQWGVLRTTGPERREGTRGVRLCLLLPCLFPPGRAPQVFEHALKKVSILCGKLLSMLEIGLLSCYTLPYNNQTGDK